MSIRSISRSSDRAGTRGRAGENVDCPWDIPAPRMLYLQEPAENRLSIKRMGNAIVRVAKSNPDGSCHPKKGPRRTHGTAFFHAHISSTVVRVQARGDIVKPTAPTLRDPHPKGPRKTIAYDPAINYRALCGEDEAFPKRFAPGLDGNADVRMTPRRRWQ
ncbi:hypothetical protein AV530_005183 [Patagioenas fasciata monilis]|uniref:Uncharacterized protein n=1 Tax=Patagioenas fasciata monilis TaxID=372326 RepID=A0A1V4K4L7_PATFA|nr:hypothetical protein AV530_005183 [Patagioenas fasciata monilis]